MKSNHIKVFLGITQIIISVWYFYQNTRNSILIATLLFLSGLITLIADKKSAFLVKLKNSLQIIAGVVVVILLIKLILNW